MPKTCTHIHILSLMNQPTYLGLGQVLNAESLETVAASLFFAKYFTVHAQKCQLLSFWLNFWQHSWIQSPQVEYVNYWKAFTAIRTSFSVHAQKHCFYFPPKVCCHICCHFILSNTESFVTRQCFRKKWNKPLIKY